MTARDDAARLREIADLLDQMAEFRLPPCGNYGLILRSIATRLAQPAPAPERAFFEWAMETAWANCDADGGSIQEKAVELGLARWEPYDHEKHGDATLGYAPDDGESWLVYTERPDQPAPVVPENVADWAEATARSSAAPSWDRSVARFILSLTSLS